jgi:chemotaxis signal transduction protein
MERAGNADAAGASMAALHVRLGGRLYWIELARVRELRLRMTLAPEPTATGARVGSLRVGGRTVPVLDLARRLGARPAVAADAQLVVVLAHGDGLAGVVVDEVVAVAGGKGVARALGRHVDAALAPGRPAARRVAGAAACYAA